MMEYFRHGRTVIPLGGIFDSASDALQFVADAEKEIRHTPINSIRFAIDEEGYLTIQLEENSYFLTYTALKDLCKQLKLPVSFVNKFPPSGLMLENLNQNPYLLEDAHLIHLIIWRWGEKEVIAGILPGEISYISLQNYLGFMQEQGAFSREDIQLDSLVVTGEELVSYFLLSEEVKREGFGFKGGFALHYSSTRAANSFVHPFYRMEIASPSGELFDFDFEVDKNLRLIRRQSNDFEGATLEVAARYEGEDLGVDYETNLKRGLVARNLSSLRFSLLKYLKSKATSTYSYNGMKIEAGAIVEEIIPEYKQFVTAHKEQFKQKEKFEINSMEADFYLPVYFNRLYNFRANLENPYYVIRYRKAISTILEKILEEVGDILLAE